jgi:hypothetical protein
LKRFIPIVVAAGKMTYNSFGAFYTRLKSEHKLVVECHRISSDAINCLALSGFSEPPTASNKPTKLAENKSRKQETD